MFGTPTAGHTLTAFRSGSAIAVAYRPVEVRPSYWLSAAFPRRERM
jgi:hypothetical protein